LTAGKRRDHVAQKFRSNADIAIRYHKDFMARLTRHQSEIVYLAIFTHKWRSRDELDTALGVLRDELANQRNGWIRFIIGGKKNLVVRVVLFAKAGKILFGTKINAINWFKHADMRREIRRTCLLRATRKT